MWRRQNACSDWSPSARHTANTTEISSLPSGPVIADHAIEFSKPRVRMHYTALYNVEMADNGAEPRTSTTPIMQIFPMPTPHVASLLVSSSASAQLPTGEIGLHQLHWTCCVTEPIPLHPKTNPVEQDKSSWAAVSCPLAIERVQSQTELLWWLWLKKVGKFPRHDEANE